MGKIQIADAEIAKIMICKKCKARNKLKSKKCRKCGSPYLRPKNKNVKTKKS